MRRWPSRWRRWRGLREPTAPHVAAAVTLGLLLGTVLAKDRLLELIPALHTVAWVSDRGDARTALASLLGLQITLVTIVLSVTTLTYQSVSSQYSPRLVGIFAATSALRTALVLFAFSGAFTVAGVHWLGTAHEGPAPRPVILGGVLQVGLSLLLVARELLRVFARIQVEELLRWVGAQAEAAAQRLAAPTAGAAPEEPGAPATRGAVPLRARAMGYVVAVDLERLQRLSRRWDLRVCIDRPIGAFVTAGEPLGWWSAGPKGGPPSVADALARTVRVGHRRHPDFDVGLGLAVLTDIAVRALSPAVNDPTTARQCLHVMRGVLQVLAAMPLGTITLADEDGTTRVAVAAPDFADYLHAAVDGVSRCGASDPEVIAELLHLAAQLGPIAAEPERRAALEELVTRALEDAAQLGHLDEARLAPLREEAEAVRHRLRSPNPPPLSGSPARPPRAAPSPGPG